MRTADQIEAQNSSVTENTSVSKKKKGNIKNLRPWPKGVSGNPGGRPKQDVAAEIAKAVFSENKEQIYKAMGKALLKGNAYTFKELAERAFGKLVEKHETKHIYEEIPDADLDRRCRELLADLGIAGQIDEIGRTEGPQGRAEAPAKQTQDTNLLPR